MTLLFSFILALFLTSVLVPQLMRLAPHLRLMDMPNERKVHSAPVPLCGGLAIAVGSLTPVLMSGPLGGNLIISLFAAAIIIVVGAVDDAQPLHWGWRLLAQGVAVSLILFAGVRFENLPLLGLDAAPWLLAGPATAFFIVGCTNAVNLADGLDGLAGGLVIPTLLAIALLAHQGEGGTAVLVCAALVGALLGFLRYNTYPASVFLGDAGSTFIGFTTAVLAVLLVQQCQPALNPAIVLLLLGVPVLDTLYAVVRRLAARQPPFRADKRHLHHQLLALGLTQTSAVGALYVFQGIMVLTAILLRYQSDWLVLGAFILIALAVIVPLARCSAARTATTASLQEKTVRTPGKNIERRNLWLRHHAWLPGTTLATVKLGVGGFFVAGALVHPAIPRDIAVCSAGIAALWLALLAKMPLPAMPLRRLLVYATAVFSAYLLLTAAARGDTPLSWMTAVYLTALTVTLIVAIRLTRRELFRVTPRDLLVLFLAVTIPNLVGDAAAQVPIRGIVAALIVMFYAAEFVMAKDSHSRWTLDLAAVLALVILSIRGLFPET